MGHRIRLTLIAVVTSLGCASAPRVDVQSEEQAIRARLKGAEAALAAKDMEKFASLYAPDAVLLLANMPIVSGREAIRATVKEFLSAPGNTLTFDATRIEVAKSGELAYEYGTNRMILETPQGRVDDRGKYLAAWKKIDGQW